MQHRLGRFGKILLADTIAVGIEIHWVFGITARRRGDGKRRNGLVHFGKECQIRADLRIKMRSKLGGEIVRRRVCAGSIIELGSRGLRGIVRPDEIVSLMQAKHIVRV